VISYGLILIPSVRLAVALPNDVAALLYMGHMFKPLISPFFGKLKNRFAYFAHDDGWLLRLYTRHSLDIARLLEGIIASKARRLFRKHVSTEDIGRKILRLIGQGVLLDFRCEPCIASIRVSHPGQFINMDDLLRKSALHCQNQSPR